MQRVISRRAQLQLLGGAAIAGLAMPAVHSWAQSAASSAQLEGMIFTRWRADPWSRGAYSFLAKGARGSHRKDLRRNVGGRLYFAGEATSTDYPSTVHGALISGWDAADELRSVGPSGGKIAVIGAGFSGLGAAQALSEAGYDVTVFEARNRLGGRVNTDRSLGLPLDLGASWIHGITDNPLTDLARNGRVKLVETDYEDGLLRNTSGQAQALTSGPNWLYREAAVQTEYGADLDQLARGARLEGDGFGGPQVIFPGGYDQLIPQLRSDYDVRLNTPVSRIAHDDRGVMLADSRSDLGVFAAVVITVPLGVLKAGAIAFAPELPQTKTKAIGRLGMGLLSKVYLKFDRPFWDRDATVIMHDGQRGFFNFWLNMYPLVGEPVILAFNGGTSADALERQSDAVVQQQALQALSRMYPG